MKALLKTLLLNLSYVAVAIVPMIKLVIDFPNELIRKFAQSDFTIMKSVIKISAVAPGSIEILLIVGTVLVPAILIFFIGKVLHEEMSDYSKAAIVAVSLFLVVPIFDHSEYTLHIVTLSTGLYTAWAFLSLFYVKQAEDEEARVLDYPIAESH